MTSLFVVHNKNHNQPRTQNQEQVNLDILSTRGQKARLRGARVNRTKIRRKKSIWRHDRQLNDGAGYLVLPNPVMRVKVL